MSDSTPKNAFNEAAGNIDRDPKQLRRYPTIPIIEAVTTTDYAALITHQYGEHLVSDTLAAMCMHKMRQRIAELETELATYEKHSHAMIAQLDKAHDRIKDLLMADDGQAYKEAERYLADYQRFYKELPE